MSKAGSGFDVCGGCHKLYKRLSTHISQNASCANHYTNRVDKTSSVATAQNSCPTTNDSQLFSSAFNQRRSSSSGRKAPANKKEQLNEVPSNNDDEEFPPFDDQTAASNIDDDHLESDEEEDQPDESVLHLYEELFLLRSNPLGLERFFREEKVQIELMQLLKDLKVPLKAFSLNLNWAAKSYERGHLFKVGCQPSREKVIKNLHQRYNMNGLIPKEKQLYLPYSKRTVSMVYFDASAVFASLLSCPTLNQDEYFLFHDQKDPFAQPSKSADVGDINTGRCYRKTYDALVKKVGVDIILPTILAMDKTHIDLAGHLQMEPITMSHGQKARRVLQTNCNAHPW